MLAKGLGGGNQGWEGSTAGVAAEEEVAEVVVVGAAGVGAAVEGSEADFLAATGAATATEAGADADAAGSGGAGSTGVALSEVDVGDFDAAPWLGGSGSVASRRERQSA